MGSNAINDFINKLTAGSRENVYLSVTPGVGLEMIQIEINQGLFLLPRLRC